MEPNLGSKGKAGWIFATHFSSKVRIRAWPEVDSPTRRGRMEAHESMKLQKCVKVRMGFVGGIDARLDERVWV